MSVTINDKEVHGLLGWFLELISVVLAAIIVLLSVMFIVVVYTTLAFLLVLPFVLVGLLIAWLV
jgi:hypothetical protein